MLPLLPLAFLSCSFFHFRLAVSTLINVTIDDTIPGADGASITYLPAGAWNLGTDCNGCTAHPDPSQMFDGTWHDGTFNPLSGSNNFPNQTLTASVSFNGTAVYVFCVLARTSTSPDGDSDMTFYIDGTAEGVFVKTAPGTTGYDYNVSVFSTTSLSAGTHILTIQNGHVNGNKSLVILDSIVYTFDDGKDNSTSSSSQTRTSSGVAVSPTSASDVSSSSKTDIGAIVGPAVAVPFAVIALLVATFFYCRRRRRLGSNSNRRLSIDPIPPPTSGTDQRDPVSIPQAGPSRPTYINSNGQVSSASGSGISVPVPLRPMRQKPSALSLTSSASHYTFTELSTGIDGSQSHIQGQSSRSRKTHHTQPSTSSTTQSGWTSQSAATGTSGGTQGSSTVPMQASTSSASRGEAAIGEEGEYPDEAPPAYELGRARSLKPVGD